MNDSLLSIGPRLRDLRRALSLPQLEVAQACGMTKSMVSKIETGRTIPTLPVLFRLLSALNTTAESFFQGMQFSPPPPYHHRRATDARPLERELASRGFNYLELLEAEAKDFSVRAVILDIDPDSSREKVTTDAFEYKYLLSGQLEYEIGDDLLHLNTGDSLFYNGRIPHVPRNCSNAPARMLVVYIHDKLLNDA